MIEIKRNWSGVGAALLACALFSICSMRTARAQGVGTVGINQTYTFTGMAFTSCFGSYSSQTGPPTTQSSPGPCVTPAPFVSGSLKLNGFVYEGWSSYEWPKTNLGGAFGSVDVSFSFTDNDMLTFNSSTLALTGCDGCLELDYSSTNLIGWQINLACSSNCGTGIGSAEIGLRNCPTGDSFCGAVTGDYSEFVASGGDPGGSNNVAGTFTPNGISAVPEPSNLLLLGAALLAVVFASRRKQRGNPAPGI